MKRSKELQNSSSLESPCRITLNGNHMYKISLRRQVKNVFREGLQESESPEKYRTYNLYCTKIRSILEYGTPIIWAGLRHYLKEDIERVQNWCLDIGLYTEEYNWVARIKKELAKNIIAYRIQKITHVKIISGTNGHGYSLRTGCNPLLAPISHTDRHKQSPRAAWLSYFNEHSKQNSLTWTGTGNNSYLVK
jgi:hypothetical protein